MMTDPIADLLTRIRNANKARKASVDVPWSRQKEEIARVLVDEGYLGGSAVVDAEPRNILRIDPRYVGVRNIPAVRRGLGVNVLSTAKGILVDRNARRENVGGEIICTVW